MDPEELAKITALEWADDLGYDWDSLTESEKTLLTFTSDWAEKRLDGVRLGHVRDTQSMSEQISKLAFQVARVKRVRDNIAATNPEIAEQLTAAMTGTWFKKEQQ